MYPIVDYSKETEEDKQNFVYALCQCPQPINFGYKIPKSKSKTWEFFTCPKCNTEIGIFVKERYTT